MFSMRKASRDLPAGMLAAPEADAGAAALNAPRGSAARGREADHVLGVNAVGCQKVTDAGAGAATVQAKVKTIPFAPKP